MSRRDWIQIEVLATASEWRGWPEDESGWLRRRRSTEEGGCGCPACRADLTDEAAAIRAARRQTSARAGGKQLPAWRGWTQPVRLSDIEKARLAAKQGKRVPAALRPFVAKGNRVYRITRAGVDLDRPLDIGMTKNTRSIADRIHEHHKQPSRGDPNVHKAIRNLPADDVLVQAAKLTRQHMFTRKAKFYENWLQLREKPLIFEKHTTPFDEADLRILEEI